MAPLCCTRCWMKIEEAEREKPNWVLGQPATIEKQDGQWYVVPHKASCLALNSHIANLQREGL